VLEVAAAALTGVAFVLYSMVFDATLYFALAACALWGIYVCAAFKVDREVLTTWGIRADNLKPAIFWTLPFLLIPAGMMLLYRVSQGWCGLPRSSVIVFVFYPLWGMAQQFLVQAMGSRNLRRLGMPAWATTAFVGLLFGLVHLPHWGFSALCAAAGVIWTALYLTTHNLIPLGFAHGWLGALAYYWILEVDPFREVLLTD
jgi:hypothetical protein